MNENEIRNFDLNLLLTLHVLLEERSVSRAAARLNLSQSAVSHALTRLRSAFHDRLLNRTQHGMLPTTHAESLHTEIKTILSKAGQLISPPQFDVAKHSGVFRITATDYGALVLFPELIRRLRTLAPHVTLECHAWHDQTLSQLEKGMVDLALGGQNPFEGFYHEPLFQDRLVLMVDQNHPLAQKQKISVKEFVAYPHAIISVVATRMKIIDELLAQRHLMRKVSVKIPHFLTAPFIIQNSQLILTIPQVGARILQQKNRVRLLPPPFKIPNYDYIQVWGHKQHDNPFHQWMRQTIKTIAARKML